MSGMRVLAVITWSSLIVAIVLAIWSLHLRRIRDRKPARGKALADRWRPTVLDVLLDAASSESLWALVRDGDELLMVDFLLQHSRRVRGRDRRRIQHLAEPYLVHVVAQLSDRSAERRARAVQTLGELGLGRWQREVVAGLEDPSPFVAMIAASALAREGNATHVGSVLKNLHRFVHWQHDFLSSMLASFGPGAATEIRDALLEPNTSPSVKAVLMDALAHLNDADSAEEAHRLLEEGADTELETACLRVLTRVGTREHLDIVSSKLESRAYPLRLGAARALGRIGGRDEMNVLREMILTDSSPWVAINAGRALLQAGGKSILRELAGSDHRRALAARQILAESR